MSVVGIDIGDDSTFVSVARMGGVDTIANEYSQRNTPSVVAMGTRQRFMGVSAENQRNLNPSNTVSFFKNLLGRSFKDPYVGGQLGNIGAEVVELKDGKLGFKTGASSSSFLGEQVLAMLLTKVKDVVKTDQGEEILNCVISVPSHFSQTQRHAVLDAAKIAGLTSVQIMDDMSALALAYGKTKTDLPEDGSTAPRYVVFVDAGCSGVQSSLMALTSSRATVLGTSSTTATGGKFLDKALLDFVVGEIESKHKCQLQNNPKALNKLRLAVEKIKKQMSANSNKLPLQIENLVDDIDVNLSLDRAKFEELIQKDLEEVKKTLSNLLNSTTVKPEQIYSVEVVGGSSRIPAIRNIIQELFTVPPSFSLNADEAVSKGCGLQAASLSSKFRTKSFNIDPIVSDAIEAVYTQNGEQEKLLLFDEGERASESRVVNIKADLPLHLAVQYGENVQVDNRFISLYQLGAEEVNDANIELKFNINQDGLFKLIDASTVENQEDVKRRKTVDAVSQETPTQNDVSDTPKPTVLAFTETSLGGLPADLVTHLISEEQRMIANDTSEISRQEAKNVLEENLYKYRAEVADNSEGVEEEENTVKIKTYFDEIENWLYEGGEDAPEQAYKDNLKTLHDQVQFYAKWRTDFLERKAKEEERRKFVEQQQQRRPQSADPRQSRQIPVMFEGVGPYQHSPHQRPQHQYHHSPQRTQPAYHQDPHQQQYRPRDHRRQMMEDPFFSMPQSFGGPMFGYGW